MTESVEREDGPGEHANDAQADAAQSNSAEVAANTASSTSDAATSEQDAAHEAADEGKSVAANEPMRAGQSRARLRTRFAGRTAVGQVREHNEDNLVVANLTSGQIRPRDAVCDDDVGERGMLFSVCDGMGGAAAGEVASQMAVDILVEVMRRGGPPRHRDALARRLVQAVEEAGRRIFLAAQKERSRRGMGTTTTTAVLIDKVLFIGEVGDSRAYLLRSGQLKLLTKDQSLVNQLIEAGHLTEDEAEAFEHSNIILQALGTAESVNVDLTFVELRKGDRLLLCSDGLSGLVHADMLRSTLDQVADPAECCTKLIELAESGGGHDNITCVVADFDGEDLSAPVDGEVFGYMQYPLPPSDDDASAFVDDETTAGGRDPNRIPTERAPRPAGPEPLAAAPSYEPELDETRANVLWVLGGMLALAGAAGVWWTLDPAAHGRAAQPLQDVQMAKKASEAEANAEVQVNIYTDVSEAMLLVNGDTQGPLSSSQTRALKLRPGAYRFEAQAEGSPVAVTVVTVRGDTPMDVFLKARAPIEVEEAQTGEATPERQAARGEPGEAPSEQDPHSEQSSASAAPVPVRERASPRPEKTGQEPTSAAQASPSTPETRATLPVAKVEPVAAPPARRSPSRDAAPTPAARVSAAEGIPENPF